MPAMRPESDAIVGALLNVLLPLQVLVLERRVEEAAVIVMSPEPSNATVLMFFVAASLVAVAALPVMLIDTAEEVAIDAKVLAPVA